jgi:hypothetical protein
VRQPGRPPGRPPGARAPAAAPVPGSLPVPAIAPPGTVSAAGPAPAAAPVPIGTPVPTAAPSGLVPVTVGVPSLPLPRRVRRPRIRPVLVGHAVLPSAPLPVGRGGAPQGRAVASVPGRPAARAAPDRSDSARGRAVSAPALIHPHGRSRHARAPTGYA